MTDPKPPRPRRGDPRRKELSRVASPRAGVDRSGSALWRPPTRRAFVAMLGAAAAAIAIEAPPRTPARDDRPRSTWAGTTRWIGHC